PLLGRVLITGGCGFIGRAIASRLAHSQCDVVLLDDLSTGVVNGLARRRHVKIRVGSVLDPSAVREAARGCDLVLHLASLVGKRLVSERRELAYATSVGGAQNILDHTGDIPVVLFSSSAVYGVEAAGTVGEAAAIDDQGALDYDGGFRGYALGKLHMERLAANHARNGRRVLIVRPFNIVGPGQTGRYGMVIPRFVKSALRDRPLMVYGDGRQTRSFSHVRTFVSVILRLIATRDAWRPPQVPVNIGTPRATSIQRLAEVVLRVTSSRSPVRYVAYDTVYTGQRDVLERNPDVTRCQTLVGSVRWPGIDAIVRDVARDESPHPRAHRDEAMPALRPSDGEA
ncbi:MAG TPA: NAD(P)-dependent oxidoreductase, partial [Candidatus Krumholzibacteria bacterium]|nr:NAD(P)-dependent oxidoreductase [Candidatus Krumholzibacteria bacterium]